jgi:hypothetical protein
VPEITAGRSAYVEPFEIFGVDVERYDEVFAEKLDLPRVIATDGDVTWAGRVRPPRRASAVGGAPDSDRRAGRLGLPMTLAYLGCRPAGVQPAVDLYRHAGETAGHPRSVLGLGVASHFLVGAASQGAREAFYPYYRAYFAQGRGACLDRSTFEAMAGPDGALLVGSTQEIIVSRVPGRVSRLLCIDALVLAHGENAVDVLRVTRALIDAATEHAQPWRVCLWRGCQQRAVSSPRAGDG